MVPIYRSDGEWVAVYHRGHVFNIDGEWLGFVVGREVYDTQGRYLGYFSEDKRLLRRRRPPEKIRIDPPPRPSPPRVPASVPLAPVFSELTFSTLDVFQEDPDRFRYVSETRPDMDSI